MADDLTEMPSGTKIMAHKIQYRGETYDLHIAEITPDGKLLLFPFDTEIHSATFINGKIELIFSDGIWYYKLGLSSVSNTRNVL